MHIFISAGEPSGDLHAGNLLRALRKRDPSLTCAGYGGQKLTAAGGNLLYSLADHPVMLFAGILRSIWTFLSLIRRADRYFSDHRPDAVVLIDYPGLHWWLARRAKARGIPVFYFVPPQLWAWGAWRVRKMRRYVDHVICSLPFEPAWYAVRGIAAHYFGHPYFDELDRQKLDEEFLARQRERSGVIVAVLPGSRPQEVELNWPSLRRAMALIHMARPDVRFLVAAFNEPQQARIAELQGEYPLPAEVHAGRTAEIIRLGEASLSVSGSVSLELLHAALPAVVMYRLSLKDMLLVRLVKKARYISLVNLLAGEELFPEFLTTRSPAEAMANQVLNWLNTPTELSSLYQRLLELKREVDAPGACARTADFILQTVAASNRLATHRRCVEAPRIFDASPITNSGSPSRAAY
jgi:lipid-A-disaccharide synthase